MRTFVKKNPVMCIAISVALISMFFVPPDREYLSYFDFKTLTCLFCTLAVVCALKNIYFFRIISSKIITVFTTVRSAILALVYITFIASMLIANDMALITFLPLGYYVITSTDNHRYLAFTFIMQNIAANLGGMLTPFGNPQNLYLYNYFNIPTGEFVSIMLVPFLIAVTMITICCLFVKNEPLSIRRTFDAHLNMSRTVIYLILFVVSIIIVFGVIPYIAGLLIIVISLIFLDKSALKTVDYPLLVTFCAFFVFSGNVSRINILHVLLDSLVNRHTLLIGAISCQFLSNVPSGILLSHFTDNYSSLLVAVNIGGTGTLIASLASLITFREYLKNDPQNIKTYLKKFSLYNFGFLITLLVIMGFLIGF
ncbi:MAG: citrate transporter [Clostridia bacterium]|nr:citrate transporter [Clostridia bacterium]